MKPDILPNLDLLNNPAICCSKDGGVICDDYHNKANEYIYLKKHSLYYKDVELNRNEKVMKIFDSKKVEVNGIYYTFFLTCSPEKKSDNSSSFSNYTHILYLNGEFSYFNWNGYLSTEDFYTVDLYLFTSLYYFIFSMYWIYQMLIHYNSIKACSKFFTFAIPLIILEQMMNLQIYSELNRSGELNMAFHVLSIICNVIKNILFRVIFFGVSIGYTVNINSFHYKGFLNSQFSFPAKKIFNFAIFMFGYLLSLIVYSITYSSYVYYDFSLSYIILSIFFMTLTNLVITWKIYIRIEKKLTYLRDKNLPFTKKYLKHFSNIIKACVVIGIVYVALLTLHKFFSNSYIVLCLKWFIDFLSETISMTIFSGLVILLQTGPRNDKEGYVSELEECHTGEGQDAKSQRIELK